MVAQKRKFALSRKQIRRPKTELTLLKMTQKVSVACSSSSLPSSLLHWSFIAFNHHKRRFQIKSCRVFAPVFIFDFDLLHHTFAIYITGIWSCNNVIFNISVPPYHSLSTILLFYAASTHIPRPNRVEYRSWGA